MPSRTSSGRSPDRAYPPGTVSLERALSKLGLASRSEARALVLAGRVRLNGEVVENPLAAVRPESARLAIDDRAVERPDDRVLLALHKPAGVLTTRRDPAGRATVYDLLTGAGRHLVPVGRLDAASTGLLLFTNDTRLADWLTDPATALPRVYLATVRGRWAAEETAAARRGVDDRGEWLHAHEIEVRKASSRETHLVIELRQGRNREIRRLCAALGHEVTRLKRVSYGGLGLDDLAPGAWRFVPDAEQRTAFPGWFLRPTTRRRS